MVRAILTNPLDEDPVLKDLLKKLDRIETRRGFARWKRHFLRQFEQHLEGPSIQNAGKKYHTFAKRLDILVMLIKQLEQLMSDGCLTLDKVTVKARQSLGELQKQLSGMIQHTRELVPGTLDEENAVGYTKFDMGAVLVRDGFVEYDRLCLCRDVLWHMRGAILDEIADRQLLEEMQRYEQHLEAFCAIMGSDLGLQGAMLKCRDILRADDDEFYQYEHEQHLERPKRALGASEYDDDDADWTEEEVSSSEESSSESEDDDDEDDDDDDDESSYYSVVEICGMEIPLRLSKYNDDSSWSDDVSDISDDESWTWTLKVPDPPKAKKKKSVKDLLPSTKGLPSISLGDDDDDEDDDKKNKKKPTLPSVSLDHDDDDSESDQDKPEPPPRPERPPPKVNVPRFRDPKATEKLKWSHKDYYHGDMDWRKVAQTAKKKTHKYSDDENEDDLDDASHDKQSSTPPKTVTRKMVDRTASGSVSGGGKRVLKVRLRKKTSSSSGDDDSTALDSKVVRRRSGSKRNGRGGGGHVHNSSKYTSDDDEGQTFAGDSIDQRPIKDLELLVKNDLNGRSDDDDDARSYGSARSSRSTKSELDEAGHRSRRRRSRSRGRKKSGNNSVDLRRMAKEAAKRRMEREGSLTAGTDDGSVGTHRSTRSTRSSASSRAKKDPLHNLLMARKSSGSENGSLSSAGSVLTSPPAEEDEESDSLDYSPIRTPKPKVKYSDAEKKERRQLCYSWYNRVGAPTRDAFKLRLKAGGMGGLTEDDADLLPWIANGARLNMSEITKAT